MQRAKTVDAYIHGAHQWQAELFKLRDILNSCALQETVKWGAPCYTAHGKNVVGIGSFKSYVGLWFYQGALLSDPQGVLINAQTGRTKALRQWRFTSAAQIKPRIIKSYVREAIGLAAAGKEIKPARNQALTLPAELKHALADQPDTKQAFESLTKGKRREYAQYIAEAKRDATKAARLDKILPMIQAGVGLNDRYR